MQHHTRSITFSARHRLHEMLLWAAVGLALIALIYQIPARHTVGVGFNDAAYVQGFGPPINRWGVLDSSSQAQTPLRWTTAQSAIIFPQIGLPATATLRWRALRSADQPLPTVRVLLNGRDELGQFRATGAWETHSFSITAGLLKANDLFLDIRAEPSVNVDGLARGIQIDRATLATNAWPILPYPAQLVYGAAAIGLAAPLARARRLRWAIALGVALLFALLYRLPVTGYPLRSLLPSIALAAGSIHLIRAVPLIERAPRQKIAWLHVFAMLLIMGFVGFGAWAARQHVVLAVPGVERDFPVFATRATALVCPTHDRATAPCVLRADGFYQLGYPLLLWLIKPLAGGSAFVAAQIIALLSSTLLLIVTYALGLRFFRAGALLALLITACSSFFVQYALLIGTDMPFAALFVAGVAALLLPARLTGGYGVLAGALCGAAFVVRHPGLVLLPFGWIVVWIAGRKLQIQGSGWRSFIFFTTGWLIAAAPQLAVNIIDTGQPLYSQQAKNIWLAVYGNIDYSRWAEASNDVALRELMLADPQRFWGNWGRNLRAFVGSGAEDTGEFGQAIGLRLLNAPANWLALIGLGAWAWHGAWRERLLLIGVALYVVGVSVGFALPRFFLPLAPVWALAAVAAVMALIRRVAARRPWLTSAQWLGAAALVLALLLNNGLWLGLRAVLERQNADAVAVVDFVQARLATGDTIHLALPASDPLAASSVLAHRVSNDPRAARILVWSTSAARPAMPDDRAPLATFGAYQVFEQ